ncbi:MAG: type IV secretion protein DotH [Alphaproteobacteria bacterium]|nr:type IV secretion protein DotH [Alphaproteobacteria bacterium]
MICPGKAEKYRFCVAAGQPGPVKGRARTWRVANLLNALHNKGYNRKIRLIRRATAPCQPRGGPGETGPGEGLCMRSLPMFPALLMLCAFLALMPRMAGAQEGGIDLPAPPQSGEITSDPDLLMMEASEAAAAAEMDAEQERAKEKHNDLSYERATMSTLPLSPEQVRAFMRRLETTQEAAVPPTTGAPKGEVKVQTVSLDPGVDPPVVNVAAGYVTTIAMLDSTGEPWPILDVGVGGNFEVSPTAAGTHVVRITPLTRFGDGNISVLLKEFKTPIIFRLVAGGPKVHLRFDARIPMIGPNGKAPLISRPRLSAGDALIMAFLDNAPPRDAKRLKVGGMDTRTMAWSMGEKVFVRTPLTLLSPAWNASVASSDGMTVYEIGDAPVLLLSDNGAMVRARLAREEE